MDQEMRHRLGLSVATAGVGFLTALALAGLIVAASIGATLTIAGLAAAYPELVASILLSKQWARKENRQIIEDPENRYHRWYMGGTKGFPAVRKFKFA